MPPQITRLVILTIAIVFVYGLARHILTPESFRQYGWFRGYALAELANRSEPVYAGQKACDECHSDELAKKSKGPHAPVTCETCHGPASQHCANPDVKVGRPVQEICIRCHERNPSRPTWLKQINLKNHYNGQGACKECHVPHQPNDVP